MRFWQDDATEVNVVWYPAHAGANVVPYETVFGATIWDSPDMDQQVVGEVKEPQAWYRGQDPVGYLGVRPCGSESAWGFGGVHGITPEINVDVQGRSSCCGIAPFVPLFGSGTGLRTWSWTVRGLGTGTGLVTAQNKAYFQSTPAGTGTGLVSAQWTVVNQPSLVGTGTGLVSAQWTVVNQPSLVGTGTGASTTQAVVIYQPSLVGTGTGASTTQSFVVITGPKFGSGTGLTSSQGTDMPVLGEYRMIFGSTPPTGWLLCNGGSFSSGTYPALAALLGDTFGMHSGSTYYLPFFGGRVPVVGGASGGTSSRVPGNYGGLETVLLTANESGSPAHHHPPSGSTYFMGTNGAVGGGTGPSLYSGNAVANQTADNSAAPALNAHENMPPWLCAGYMFIFAGP